MEEVGALNNSRSAQRPPKPPQLRCSCWLHHAEMVIRDREYDVGVNGLLELAPSHPCINQIPLYLPSVPAYPFLQKSAGYRMGGEESENKPRVLLAVRLSPQRARQRHAKGWRTRNGLL